MKNSFFKFQLTHVFLNNLQSIYNLRSQVFLEIVTPSRGIDFKLTSDVFRIFGGVDLFRLSVFFVVKYFSFFCQISWFTSVCFLLCFCLYWYSPKSSRAVTLFYRVAVCSVFAYFAQFLRPFVMSAFSITKCFVQFKLNFRFKNARKCANFRKNISQNTV